MDCGYDDYPTLKNSLSGEVKLVKNILDMALDLIDVEIFQFLMDLVKM